MSADIVPSGGKRSAWMAHVKKTMRAHKGLSLKKALVKAAESYKKTAKRGGGGGSVASTAALVAGRRRRGTRRSRRS